MVALSAVLLLTLHAAAVQVKLQAAVQDKPVDVPLDCSKLKDVIFCDNPKPRALGSGVYGQAWLVKSKVKAHGLEDPDGMMVMKTFFVGDKKESFATSMDFRRENGDLYETLLEAKRECELTIRAHQEGDSHPGARYLVRCFGHNIEAGSRAVPLYTLMNNCGEEELYTFQQKVFNRTHDPLKVLGSIFKQVLMGLDCLAHLKPPIVHHDLKSENVVVKTHQGSDGKVFYTANLIDFGGAIEATEEDLCKFRTTSNVFGAPEFWTPLAECGGEPGGFAMRAPSAFDVYSAAVLWFELLTGNDGSSLLLQIHELWCQSVKDDFCSEATTESTSDDSHRMLTDEECISELTACSADTIGDYGQPNHHLLFRMTKKEHFFGLMDIVLEDGGNEIRAKFVSDTMRNEAAKSFTQLCMKAFTTSAEERPTAAQLLDHDFMRGLKASDDPTEDGTRIDEERRSTVTAAEKE